MTELSLYVKNAYVENGIIVRMRRLAVFLFDTWYGAFAVLYGTSFMVLAEQVFERLLVWQIPSARGPWLRWVGLTVALPFLGAVCVYLVSWMVALVRRRWKRAFVQLVLGGVWIGCFGLGLGAIFVFA